MSSISTKAIIAQIDFGFTQIEGLMLPDGSYGISITQAQRLLVFSSSPHLALKSLKVLLGKGFEPTKVKTELSNNPANVLTITQFTKLVTELAIIKQNPTAIAFLRASAEETIERRFDLAFNQKVEESERNERLALRMKRLLARHQWTDTLRDRHLALYGVKPNPDQYKNWTVKVNLELFEKKHFNCNRDNMCEDEQRTIELFESMCVRKAKQYPKDNPEQILEKVLAAF